MVMRGDKLKPPERPSHGLEFKPEVLIDHGVGGCEVGLSRAD